MPNKLEGGEVYLTYAKKKKKIYLVHGHFVTLHWGLWWPSYIMVGACSGGSWSPDDNQEVSSFH